MILIIPVRFAQDDDVWSRQQFENWMQPLRPFSLANYWWQASRGFFDLSCEVLDPIDLADPGPVAVDKRGALHDAVVKAATEQRRPDWAHTDIVLIWFARSVGWWGGGEVAVGDGAKVAKVTVVDSITPFDVACQELGHSFGFAHEWAADGTTDYGSPYSAMSARRYGVTPWQKPGFLRQAIAELPDGGKNQQPPFLNEPAGRIIGPMLPAAQLYREQQFRDSRYVVHPRGLPAVQRLYALDYQVREPMGPLPVLVAVPSNRRDGRLFYVELRRRHGFDGGLGEWDDETGKRHTGPDEALVVHSRNPDGRIRYEGVAPLRLTRLQQDWPFPAGDFTLRVNHVDAAHEFVDVEVRAGSIRSFPIRGVLLAGGFRTQEQLNAMSNDDMRNTLIVEMTAHSNQRDYQAYSNEDLAGVGAVMVFLRLTGVRDDAALSRMSADEQRNTMIVVLDAQTRRGRALQGLSNLDLARIALGVERV